MIIASDVLPILTFMKGFKAAPAGQINGPYFAGTLNSLKVYVSPAIKAGRFLLGVNGDDMMSSVAVSTMACRTASFLCHRTEIESSASNCTNMPSKASCIGATIITIANTPTMP